MKQVIIKRSYLPNCTIGEVITSWQSFRSIERPWLDNKVNESCIPEGTYIVKRDKTGKHQYYAVQNVPNRTFIEMHAAKRPSDLLGCIALGMEFDPYYYLLRSEEAMDSFLREMGDEDFLLTIKTKRPE